MSGHAPALLARRWRKAGVEPLSDLSAAMTRWRIACAPSERLPAPGVGRSRWTVDLARQRGGPPFTLQLEACDDTGLERIALVARAEARRQAFARLGRDLTADQVERLDALLRIGGTPNRSSLAWIRDWPEAPGASNLKPIVERLDYVRNIGIKAERARRIHASRYAVIAREAARWC